MISMIRSRLARISRYSLILPASSSQFVGDFLDADLGQALQAQFQNGAGLGFGQVIGAVVIGGVGRIVDQRDVFAGYPRRASGGSSAFRAPRRRRQMERMVATISSMLVTATARPHRIWLRSRALRSSNAVRRATTSSRKIDEGGQEAAQGQLFGAATVQRQHVAAEIGLHRREAEQLVQHHLGGRIALQLDHDAHAVAVGFVLHVGDAFDLLVARLPRRSVRSSWPCSPDRGSHR